MKCFSPKSGRLSVRFAALAMFMSIVWAEEAAPDPKRFAIDTAYPIMARALKEGNLPRARAVCEQVITWDPQNPVHRYNLACIESRAGAGNFPRAIAALKEAIALGFSDAAMLKSDPDLAAVRTTPEFAEILEAVARTAPAKSVARNVAPTSAAQTAERTPASATKPVPVPAPAVAASAAPAPASVSRPAPPITLPPQSPKSGHVIGRAVLEDGRPVPEFTVAYSGFEDGKLAKSTYGGTLIETINNTITAKNGRYEIKVPAGAYRVSAYVTYRYRNRTYLFDLDELNPLEKHDYSSLKLDKLGPGLVRDFVLRMTGKRAGAWEDTETGYMRAYHGGRVDFDVAQMTGLLGGGNKFSPTLDQLYPPESRIEVTMAPNGPRVDGSTGSPVIANVMLGDAGRWTFNQRGVYPGAYTATARLITPDGKSMPLRVSLTPARTILASGAAKYDELVMEWQTSVLVDFLPNDIKPGPSFGVKPVKLYLGP